MDYNLRADRTCDDMAAEPAAPKPEADPSAAGPFSMTDEEGDLLRFRAYLASLSPEALWDVFSHLDPDRYPRRREALLREMDRRRLFFVPPYTRRELQLRAFLGVAVFLAALAATLRTIGGFLVEPIYERLPFFLDLAVGGPKAARLVFPFVVLLAQAAGVATVASAILSLLLLARRRIRPDIALMAVLASGAIVLLLAFARRGG